MKAYTTYFALTLLLVSCLSCRQIFGQSKNRFIYFSAIVSDSSQSDKRLLSFVSTSEYGYLVNMKLTGRWSSGSLVVYREGFDYSVIEQEGHSFQIQFAKAPGLSITESLVFSYDKCLTDLTMTESTITVGKGTFTEWKLWRKNGSDQIPVSFLFPGIYPYFGDLVR